MIEYDARRWRDQLLTIRGSVDLHIGVRVLVAGGWAALVVAGHRRMSTLAIPSTVHALAGVAMGLLLVFRTNASYDRFWEGRRMWGSIVNESRNVVRQAVGQFGHDAALVERLARWTVAFSYACMNHLRERDGLGPPAATLPADEVAAALAAPHAPLAVAARMTGAIVEARRKGHIIEVQQVALDANVQALVDCLGACERIHKTPLPFAYVVHLRRALVLFCLTLPFALVDSMGWATVAATLAAAFVFFGIEAIGVEIEDPFGEDANDLPLDQICAGIERTVMGQLPGHSDHVARSTTPRPAALAPDASH